MRSLIYDRLQDILNEGDYIRLHMPGHKGRYEFPEDCFITDFTEVPGSDNISDPDGVLWQVMKDIACIYGVKDSLILVNGSTVGIIAAMLYACKPGDSFVIPRNSHRSVYSALMLQEIEPVYIYPRSDDPCSYPCIRGEQIEEAFLENPNCKGVILTSPTYEGVCLDIEQVGKIAKKYDKMLIVDEAHGAHLHFHNGYPHSSTGLGADMVIQSTHKTLGSLNQGALLHICSEKVDKAELRDIINMLQTSSPSYPIMISIENAVKEAKATGERKLGELLSYYHLVEEELRYTNYRLEGTELKRRGLIYDYDKSKLWITNKMISGNHMAALLREKHQIQVEMWNRQGIIAMMGMGTVKRDMERLLYGLIDIDKDNKIHEGIMSSKKVYPCATYLMSPRETMKYEKEYILLSSSAGRVASELIIPYPPGIPIIAPGEMMNQSVIDYLDGFQRHDVIGLSHDGFIKVIK